MTLVKMATEPWRPHSRKPHREEEGGPETTRPAQDTEGAPRVRGRSSTEINSMFSVMAVTVISRMRNIMGRSEIHPPAFLIFPKVC